MDQVNAGRLVDELQEKDPAGKYFSQPYKNQRQHETLAPEINADEDDILEGMANKCEQTLMFCMQTAFMKMAMEKYSGDVVCLDATNKTTDYSLPVFSCGKNTNRLRDCRCVHCSIRNVRVHFGSPRDFQIMVP